MKRSNAHAIAYRQDSRRAWARRPGTQDLIEPGGLTAIWKGSAGWHVFDPDGNVIGMGGIRNLDGSYVYTDGVKS